MKPGNRLNQSVNNPVNRVEKLAVKRGYDLLLRAYLASFRLEFTLEMEEDFSDPVDAATRDCRASLACLAARETAHTAAAIM